MSLVSKSLASKINIVLRGIQLISIHLLEGNFGQGQICIRGRRGLLTTMWQLAGCTVWWVLKGGEGYLWGRWGWRWPTIYIGLQILAIFPLPIEIILCFQVTFLIMMYGMDNCYNVQCYNGQWQYLWYGLYRCSRMWSFYFFQHHLATFTFTFPPEWYQAESASYSWQRN